MNKVIFAGRLTRDPEVRQSQTTTIARFSLAVDRKFKKDGDPDADFFNCVSFGKTAEAVEKYLKQGTKVMITGRVENDNYTDKNGNKVYGTRIYVEEWEFCESKAQSSTEAQKTQNSQNAKATEGFMDIPDGIQEELPFN